MRAVQGDAEHLGDVLAAASADLVLCHGVLEVVDDVDASLRGLRTVLRDSGRLSLLLAQRSGAVLARAAAGQLRQAPPWPPTRRALGRRDPLQRRFDAAAVPGMLGAAGFTVLATEGVRAVADLVPHQLVDGDAGATALLARLEQHAGADADLSGAAPQLHVHAAPGLSPSPAPGGPAVSRRQLDRPGLDDRVRRSRDGLSGDDTGCPVLHVDMDAFYASVELWTGPTCGAARWSSAAGAAGGWCSRPPTRPAGTGCTRRCR